MGFVISVEACPSMCVLQQSEQHTDFLCPHSLQAAPLLVHVSSFAAASHKKKLYVIGGGPNGKLATDKTQCYDPLTNKWILKSPMPVEAKCINAVSFQDHIYVVGESVMTSYICSPAHHGYLGDQF